MKTPLIWFWKWGNFFTIYIHQTIHKHFNKYTHTHLKPLYIIRMTECNLVYTCIWDLHAQIKKNYGTNYGRVDNKTQVFHKIISSSPCRFDGSNKRISLHIIYCCSSQVPTLGTKLQGWVYYIKEINKHQMKIIRKKTITIIHQFNIHLTKPINSQMKYDIIR